MPASNASLPAHPATCPTPAAASARRRRLRHWWLALGYFLACALGHLQFSLWLVRTRPSPGGDWALRDLLPLLLPVAALATAVWVVLQAWRCGRLRAALALWSAWAACVALSDRWLMYSVPEYAHYPQYAILAWLIARAVDPARQHRPIGRILFWSTLLGMADEALQYLWITTGYSGYLDFNDFLSNLLGSVAGLLLYYLRPLPAPCTAPVAGPRHRWRAAWREWLTAAALTGLLALGLASGRVAITPARPVPPGGIDWGSPPAWQHATLFLQRTVPPSYGSWAKGPYRGRHWVLGPLAGSALLLAAGTLFGLATGAAVQGIAAAPARRSGHRADG